MRIYWLAVLGILSVAGASAAGIQIGGVNGLTSNYITVNGGSLGSSTAWTEANYSVDLFASATNGTDPVPYAGYSKTTANAGVIGNFAMVNDGLTSGLSNNFWAAPQDSSGSWLTVPVGLNNVANVQTLISNVWGVAQESDTTLKFNFHNVSTLLDYAILVNLTNSNYYGQSATGQIATGVNCTGPAAACGDFNNDPLSPYYYFGGYANGQIAGSTDLATTSSGTGPVNPSVNVLSNYAYTYTGYTSIDPNTFFGNQGNLVLTAQKFNLGAIVTPSLSQYLVSVQVQDNGGGPFFSQTALSAITVEQAPEPGTVFLLMSGLGLLGFARFRRA